MPTNAQNAKPVIRAFQESAKRVQFQQIKKLRGTTVGEVRTQQIPEAPAQTTKIQDTSIIHVVDVRLIDDADGTIARDVLIAFQAGQLLTKGSAPILDISTLEEGTPVELQHDSMGNLQVVGRLAITSAVRAIDTYELADFGLLFSWGLEGIKLSSDPARLIIVNDARTAEGLIPLIPTTIFIDMSDAEIETIFGINIADYNDSRASESPPLLPISAQDAVNIERVKLGLAPLPDDVKPMDVTIYIDFFDSLAIGTSFFSIPGLGRFLLPPVMSRNRGQTRELLLYGLPTFVYGQTDYGAAIYPYLTP